MDAWLMEYPQDLLVRTSLAETYMALGRLPAAEREYQAALEVAPDNAWTLNNLARSEEHTSELQSLMRISYAVFCLKKKKYIVKKRVTINSRFVQIVQFDSTSLY